MNDETNMDDITIPDDDKIEFSDKPKPADPAATTEAPAPEAGTEGGDPPASEEGEQIGKPPERKRNKKTFSERIGEYAKRALTAEEEKAAALARADLLERQLLEVSQRHQTASEQTLTQREQDATSRKQKAIEEQDMVAYDAAQNDLLEIKLARREQPEPQPQPAPARRDAEPEPVHASAKAWIGRNEWFNREDSQHLAAEAMRIEARLRQSGVQLGDELYKKLDEELADLPDFDEVRGVKANDSPVDPPAADAPPPRSPVSSSRSDAPPPPKPRPNALTEHDKRTMRTFKLDPDNAKHRETYLQYKK